MDKEDVEKIIEEYLKEHLRINIKKKYPEYGSVGSFEISLALSNGIFENDVEIYSDYIDLE